MLKSPAERSTAIDVDFRSSGPMALVVNRGYNDAEAPEGVEVHYGTMDLPEVSGTRTPEEVDDIVLAHEGLEKALTAIAEQGESVK